MPRSSATVEVADPQHAARPGCAGALSISKMTSRPTISVARLCWRRRLGVGGADDAARGAAR